MVAAALKLDHLLTTRARLPSFGLRNVHKRVDILILNAETIMLLVLACDTSLLGTFHACSYTCDNVGRPDPVGACTVAAIGAIQVFKLLSFSDEPRKDRWGQKRYAADDRNDLGTALGREVRS